MDQRRDLPPGWSEVESPDYITEKYDPRPVTLFTFAERDVGVHALPNEPNTPHTDTHEYRVGVVQGNRDELESAEPLARAHGFEDALAVAEAFMEGFDEAAGVDEAAVEAAKNAAKAAPEAEPLEKRS